MKNVILLLCLVICLAGLPSCRSRPPEKSLKVTVHTSEPRVRRPAAPPPAPEIVERNDRTVCFYRCRYASGEEIQTILDDMSNPDGTVSYSRPLNLLVFSDPVRANVEAMLEYVKNIDVYHPQVLVEAKVVEINLDKDTEFELSHLFEFLNPTHTANLRTAEITLTTPGTNPSDEGISSTIIHSGTGTTNVEQFTNFLRLLVTEGKAEILSSPNLIVSAGNTASIITGEEVPVTNQTAVSGAIQTNTVFKRVGVKLRVTPLQVTNEMVYLEVNPEVSTVIGYTTGETSNPIVAVRNTSTTLKAKDGELIAIGGLLREEDRYLEKGVPGLSKIPVMGKLFSASRHERDKTQLVFFLRIQILPEPAPGDYTIPAQGLPDEVLDGEIQKMKGMTLDPGAAGAAGGEPGEGDTPAAGEGE